MKQSSRLIISIFAIFLLTFGSVITTSVMAQDDDNEEETEDEFEDDEDDLEDDEREISVEQSEEKVIIESETESGEREDELKIEVDTADDAQIRLEYSSENDTTESEAELKVEFFELIEFEDNTNDGVYNESEDTVVQPYQMSDYDFEPITYTTETNQNNVTEHIISVVTTDGVFELVLHAVGEFTSVNGTDLKPTSIKIDIIIENFDFQQSDTKLALYSEVESSFEVESEVDDDIDDQIEEDEETIKQSGEGIFAFYSWKNTAEVDGQPTNVLASYEENTSTEQKLYLNYEQGEQIIHDPKLGVSIGIVDSQESGLGFSLWLATILAFAVPVLLIKRRKISR